MTDLLTNSSKLLAKLNSISSVHTLLPIILFIILLPHLVTTPVIISAYIIAILLWFILHTLAIIPLPGKLIRFVLIILALALLLMNYGFVFSQKASISLLAIMVSLKLLEIHNVQDRRNIFPVLFLGYFILVTHFLHSQDILLGLFAFINTIVLTMMLSSFNRKPQNALAFKDNLLLISRLFVKALPIAIVLFLFFPRVQGPLWSLPEDGLSAGTGLSNKMFPGSVSSLVESNAIAFRVDFHEPVPAADKLYWRGPVLSETDGFLWSQKKHQELNTTFSDIVKNSSNDVSYTITLEPHRQKWLFALEIPVKVEGDTIEGFYFNHDLQLLNKSNIHQLTQYHVTSRTQFFLDSVAWGELRHAMKFPSESNPRTLKLGRQWQKTIRDQKKIVATGLNYYKDKPFYYTKQPDVMTNNPSDQFLFDKQRGFCEHYASSFVLLMRAAGIPARVVTGYQGIEKNDIGNYYVVRQSNAHAWAEVWLNDAGWLRVDPTSMIPPDRIEADILQTNLDRLNFSALNLPDLSAQQRTAMYNLYRQVQQTIDNIKHNWNNWILGYDQSKQSLLLSLMGLDADWKTLIMLLMGSLIVLMLLFQLFHIYQLYQRTDKVYFYYVKFIKKLNRAGLPVRLSDGPEAIKQRAGKRFPQHREAIQEIMEHYIQIRYASHDNKDNIEQFIREVKLFKYSKP